MQYIQRDLTEEFYSFSAPPSSLQKKVTLLNYFHNYMSEHLLKVHKNHQISLTTSVKLLANVLCTFACQIVTCS